jgi:hypothetical protein
MILLFYYFRRYPKATEGAAKAIGGLAAGVGIVKFDVILAYVNHYLGAGAHIVSIAVVSVVVLFLIYEALFRVETPAEVASEQALGPFEKAPIEGSDDGDAVTPSDPTDLAGDLLPDLADALD